MANHDEIDEQLYSRQLYVLGKNGMELLSKAFVLICGLNGLGLEVAKNIILTGVRQVTLHDTEPVTWGDLSSHYYASDADVGLNRAHVSYTQLAELNHYVNVVVDTCEGQEELEKLIKQHEIVVLTAASSLEEAFRVSDICRANEKKFILANTHGLYGQIFCDFGPGYVVTNVSGQPPFSVPICQVEKSRDGMTYCRPGTHHEFDDETYVSFRDVEGMLELNNCPPRKVNVETSTVFMIGDTRTFEEYTGGGVCSEVKLPTTMPFKSLRESYENPDFYQSDSCRPNAQMNSHLIFKTLQSYRSRHSGGLPRPWNSTDAEEFVQILRESKEDANAELTQLATLFAMTCSGNLAPIQGIVGGTVAQEVTKVATGLFRPLHQWCYISAFECLPEDTSVLVDSDPTSDASSYGPRYSGQVAVFGPEFQRRVCQQSYFVVGAGAVGCELLKNFAMMGVGCPGEKASRGGITVTDMDQIERSNLNRQFLFRPHDIGRPKSVVATEAARKMNPKMNIHTYELRVGTDTESVFSQSFFEQLDGVANALDNAAGRQYMDARCRDYLRPMLDPGTEGTKAQVIVVVPHLTNSLGAMSDNPESRIPTCTLKHFPYLIEHTIIWARNLFADQFTNPGLSWGKFAHLSDDKETQHQLNQIGNHVDLMRQLHRAIIQPPNSFPQCVEWARQLWQDLFVNEIAQLLHNYPSDHKTKEGMRFWANEKRCPQPLVFDINNETHLNFVESASRLCAAIFRIDANSATRGEVAQIVEQVTVETFQPRLDCSIPADDTELELQKSAGGDSGEIDRLKKEIGQAFNQANAAASRLHPVDSVTFDKDETSNLHMTFVTAASNLRASNYSIPPVDLLKCKQIAGRIIPAIATTTAVVAGFLCLEIYKLIQGNFPLVRYRDTHFDLALPDFSPSIPRCAPDNLWRRIEVNGPMALSEFIKFFETRHNFVVTLIFLDGSMMLYCAPEMSDEHAQMNLAQLAEEVKGEPLLGDQRSLMLQITGERLNASGPSEDIIDVVYRII